MMPRWRWLILIGLVLAALYGSVMLAQTGGQPVAPLDDAYIHFQYARQIVNGEAWQYNSDDPTSTGATSLLYPFALALGLVAGLDGAAIVWWALLLGLGALIVSAWLVALITRRLFLMLDLPSPGYAITPAVAAILFMLSGAVQWGYFNGMETGVFTLALLGALAAYLEDRPGLSAALLLLAAFLRPEGLFLAAVSWLVLAWAWGFSDRSRGRRALVSSSLAVLLSLMPLALNVLLTGSLLATGARAKSWFENAPFRPVDILLSVGHGFLQIIERLTFGFLAQPGWPLLPLLLPLAAVAWFLFLRRRRWAIVALSGGWVLVAALAAATLITAIWQEGRYQVPVVALLYPLAAVASVYLLGRRRSSRSRERTVLLFLVALSLWQTGAALEAYGRSTRTVARQQVALGAWIAGNLPADALVAVHDAGAIRYVGERPTFDMIGLTTQDVAAAWRQGIGALFETMETTARPPTHFATYPDAFFLSYLQDTDLFTEALFSVEVPDFSSASAAGPRQTVYRADWRLAHSGRSLRQADLLAQTAGMTLVDRLDVADLAEEAMHELTWWEGDIVPGFPTEVWQLSYRTDAAQVVLDGGRLLTGGLAFTATVRPAEPALLVARLHAQEPGAVAVVVDNRPVGTWRYPAVPGEWLETSFVIPGQFLTDATARLSLAVVTTNANARFAPYHFWLWQGESHAITARPERPLEAQFGEGIRLLGYSLDADRYRSAGFMPLTLFWQMDAPVAPAPVTADATVFVHLYNDQEELVAQSDHRPYFGLRPPYTWQPGEVVADGHSLALPADLPVGTYTLMAGLYDPQTLARLPLRAESDYKGGNDRLFLQTIEIVAD